MLKPHLALEDVEHGLDNEALAQHALVGQRHQMVLHIAPDAGDQVQATLPKFAEQVPADMALVVDHDMQPEAKEPPSSGHSNGYAAGTFGQPRPWRSCRGRPGRR